MTVTSHLMLLLKKIRSLRKYVGGKKNTLSLGDFNLTYQCLFRTVAGSLATLEMHSAVVMLMNGDLSWMISTQLTVGSKIKKFSSRPNTPPFLKGYLFLQYNKKKKFNLRNKQTSKHKNILFATVVKVFCFVLVFLFKPLYSLYCCGTVDGPPTHWSQMIIQTNHVHWE